MPTTGLFSQHYNIAPLNANIRIFVKGDLKTTSGPNSVTTLLEMRCKLDSPRSKLPLFLGCKPALGVTEKHRGVSFTTTDHLSKCVRHCV